MLKYSRAEAQNRPEAPCRSCDGWTAAGCNYVRVNDVRGLLERGACDTQSAVKVWIRRYLAVRAPGSRSLEEDLVQEAHLLLLQEEFSFPQGLRPTLSDLRRYLRRTVLNHMTDYLRKQRQIPKKRCGACLYLSARNTCSLPEIRSPSGASLPNPHFEKILDPHTNPARLKPPCPAFFWRYRRQPLESVQPKAPCGDRSAEEAHEVLTEALAVLVARGPTGRLQAYLLREHYVKERPASELARQLDISERTVRRQLKAGLSALKRVLRETYGLGPEDLP